MLTTQILSEVEELCDDILILNRGRQAARGDLHTLKLLSQGVYDVTVDLRSAAGRASRRSSRRGIRSACSMTQNTVEVTLKEDDGGILAVVGGAGRARTRAAARGRRREPRRHLRRADQRGDERRNRIVSALSAVMYREGKIRATNALFIFWDVVYPLGYLLVFGVGMNDALGFSGLPTDYHAFFLAGVLGMAGFGIASNTAWSFFMDRDNGIFYEMLTYPISRAEYLVGKVLFNIVDRRWRRR